MVRQRPGPGPEPDAVLRPARPADVACITRLVEGADLPAMFIEEFLEGFIVAERGGAFIGCGGLEVYDGCGVLRSVVLDGPARGLGLGRRLAEALIAGARARGLTDLYLFTMDALGFWQRLGFAEVGFGDWKGPARACWQYQALSQDPDLAPGVRTMWRPA